MTCLSGPDLARGKICRYSSFKTSVDVVISGTACGADFYATANDKASSPEESSGLLDPNTTGERRRSGINCFKKLGYLITNFQFLFTRKRVKLS